LKPFISVYMLQEVDFSPLLFEGLLAPTGRNITAQGNALGFAPEDE